MSPDLPLPEHLKKDISIAVGILLRAGCTEVYVFGSLARGTHGPDSDVDIATVGLPKDRFFATYGEILSEVHRQVDLVALDYDQDFGSRLKEEGLLTRVA